MGNRQLWRWAASNWFVVVAPLLAVAALLVARSAGWRAAGATLEAALVFDACFTLPVLYALCYSRSKPLRQVVLRMLALACLGIYVLGWIVPADAQLLLPRLAWARTAGLTVLILIELRLVVAVVRMVFGTGASAEQRATQTGAPRFVARLTVLEARMWKAVWRFLRRN